MGSDALDVPNPSCDTCGYKTTKKTMFGKVRDWCFFQEQYLDRLSMCSQFVNEVDVGFGKGLFFAALSGQRQLSDSERALQDLIMTAVTVPCDEKSGSTGDYFKNATPQGLSAMVDIGDKYRLGNGVPQSEKLAFYYYLLAGNQGHAEALYLVALCLYSGTGVEKNEAKAYRLMESAAIRGYAMAQYYSGVHDKEIGRISSAKSNFKSAAKQGHAFSQYCLADIYIDEWINGQEKSLKKGMFWYLCAYLHGNSSARASSMAKEQIDYRVQHGYPERELQLEINRIKMAYPHYLNSPKQPNWGSC